jgi:hypothetical protein
MDETYWEERAEEARLLVRALASPTAKTEMLQIAAAYAGLARSARRREKRRAASDRSAARGLNPEDFEM